MSETPPRKTVGGRIPLTVVCPVCRRKAGADGEESEESE
jgi:hypothetical protein